MLIQSLTLENVKSYTQTTVKFSPGANAIVGNNGSGKTTILEAIGFALFDHRPGRQTDFVREGRELGSVTVDFLSSYDERAYRVVRRCGSSSVYRIFDQELSEKLCEGKADVSQFMREHLGIDPDIDPGELFRNAVGVPQGSFTAAFLTTPSVRKGIFDPLLKVAEYRRAYEKLREPLSLLTKRQNDQAVIISGLQGELTRLPSASAETEELTGRIGRAERELQAAQEELTAAEAARQAMAQQRERLLELQRTAQMQRQAVAEQERTLAAARQRRAESEEATAITEANRSGHETYRAAQQAQHALNERMAQRRQLQEERVAVHTRLTQAATQEDAHKRTLVEIAAAEKTVADLTDAVAEQETLEAALRDAQRQMDRLQDVQARVQREQATVDAAQERSDRLRADVAQAQEIEASLEPLQASVGALQQTMAAQQVREASLQAELETVKEQGTRLRDSDSSAICPICEQPLSAVHRQQLIERLRQRWNDLTEDSQAAAQAVRQADSDRKQARSTLTRQEKALRSLPRQDAVDAAETGLAELRVQLAETRARAATLTVAPDRVEQLQQSLTALADPRRRRDVARQQASGRKRVEEALQQRRAEAEQQRVKIEALDERIAAFGNVDEEADRLKAALDTFQTADDLYRRNQAAAEALPQRRQEVAEAEKALQTAEERYASAQAQLAAGTREFDEERFQEAQTQVVESRSRNVQLETNLGHWRERLAQTQAEIAQLQVQAQRLVDTQAQHGRLLEQSELLTFLRSVLREAGPFVTNALVRQTSYAANQLFGDIMEDYTRTLHWQEDYGIILEVDGRERAFAQLSGGEQMTAALAVRLALLQEMSHLAIAFFDEPTTNLDDIRRDALARQIVGIRGFQQLFIISHDDSFEQATENLIRVEKTNGVSRIG